MKLRKQFSNLKKGAKKVFVGMLVLCLISTATGIGSIFAYADEEHDHLYPDKWQYYDDSTHRKPCTIEECDNYQEDTHSYSDWEPYGDGLERRVCSECEHEEIREATTPTTTNTHSFGQWQLDPNNVEQHIRYCQDDGCDAFETARHNIGDWTPDPGSCKEKRTCECGYVAEERDAHDLVDVNPAEPTDPYNGYHVIQRCNNCDYEVTEQCSFDENGICTKCGEHRDTDEDSANITPPGNVTRGRMNNNLRMLSLAPTAVTDGLVQSGKKYTGGSWTAFDVPVPFEYLYHEIPSVYSGLEYNAKEQELIHSEGVIKADDELSSEYGITNVSVQNVSISPNEVKNAGQYTVTFEVQYTYIDDITYAAIGTYTVSIAKANFSDVVFTNDTTSYVNTSLLQAPYFVLSLDGTNLSSSDYSYNYVGSSSAFSTYPDVGETCTIEFAGSTTNFNTNTVSKTIVVEDVYPTYNGSTAEKSSYVDQVTIEPPAGYKLALPVNATTPSDFVDSAVVSATKPLAAQYLFFKHSGNNKIIRKSVSFVIDNTGAYTIDSFVETYPVFNDVMTYTGNTLNFLATSPVLKEVPNVTASWRFVDQSNSTDTNTPGGEQIGEYKYKFYVDFTPNNGNSPVSVSTIYKTTIVKDFGHDDIAANGFSANANDYQSLNSSTNILDYFNVKDKGFPDGDARQQLQRNVDYSVTADKTQDYYDAGTSITLTYTGLTTPVYNAYYSGTVTKEIPVSTVDVKLNGAAQVARYNDKVVFTADGYTINDSSDGVFNSSFEYALPCENLTLPIYFKKTGTNRVVRQTITGLNIGQAAAITVLYDGIEELKPYYFDTVRLSAEGYLVSPVQSGRFAENYNLEYDASKTMQPVPDFNLYFKDKNTGVVYTKKISGINLYESPSIDILYNNAALKEWYNSNVSISAAGYKVSDNSSSGFSNTYLISGNGTIQKKLYFKNNTTGLVSDFLVVVAIDKTAPTGVINLSSYSSDSFTTKDAVKAYTNGSQKAAISASDALSGIDYIHYYVSDTFYASPSDVKAAISEKSGAWRTYSSSSQPALVKDKNNYIYAKLVDKAGNETIISLGNILYDTVAPKMTTAKVTPSNTDSSKSLIGLAGTDKLSGINRFKYIFQEKEEGKEYSTPSKDHMFNNGEIVYTSSEQDGTAVASATIDVLDAAKTYLFYFIAVDRAGNISDVMTQEVKGSSASKSDSGSGSGSGASGKSSGGGSGLTPAANGIAGSGSGSGSKGGSGSGSGSSSSAKSSKSSSKNQSALGDKDREINRNPYIAEATGNVKIGINETSGWNKIASEVNKADKGAVIEVEMAGLSNVSNELFTSMNNRDVQVKLLMAEDVEWEIKGEEVPDARSDIDMGVRLGSRNIPEQIIADVAGTNPHVEFSINHNGDFGFVATIAVPVGESNKGMYTTLYHYDEAKKELEVAGDGRVDDRGYAKFPLTHASDYTVVITPERILTAAETDAQTNTLVGAEAESQSSQYLDGARLRLTDLFRIKGSMRIWLFFIALLSATICMVILYLPALQSRNQNDQGDLF
ncbi:MAG: hypothetical protein E7308_00225 [Butyrivibrio sp.]|nr:hypothetical protein [Butyrivibrio sp.]